MKHQVIVIHGGDVHDTYEEYIADLNKFELDKSDIVAGNPTMKGWKEKLPDDLGNDYEVFTPEMPNWMNAKYLEWEIWFEKILPFLHEGPIFIGHSLGGIFLARYFAENNDTKKTAGVFLLAAPYRDKDSKDQLADFVLPKDLSRLNKLGDKLHLYHSTDDPIVDFKSLKEYTDRLPEAQTRVFKDKNHFRVAEFPEIVKDIKALYK